MQPPSVALCRDCGHALHSAQRQVYQSKYCSDCAQTCRTQEQFCSENTDVVLAGTPLCKQHAMRVGRATLKMTYNNTNAPCALASDEYQRQCLHSDLSAVAERKACTSSARSPKLFIQTANGNRSVCFPCLPRARSANACVNECGRQAVRVTGKSDKPHCGFGNCRPPPLGKTGTEKCAECERRAEGSYVKDERSGEVYFQCCQCRDE